VAELVQLDVGRLQVCAKHEFVNLKLYLLKTEAKRAQEKK